MIRGGNENNTTARCCGNPLKIPYEPPRLPTGITYSHKTINIITWDPYTFIGA